MDPSKRLLPLIDDSATLFAAFDAFDRLKFANLAFRTAFFIEADEWPLWSELMRRNFAAKRGTVITSPDFEGWLQSTLSRRGKVGYRSFETSLHDGRWLWMTETVSSDGWMLCVAADVTGLRERGRSLRQDRDNAVKASQTDALTGVANRRFVTQCTETMLARDTELPGCLCVLDLDNFKRINDHFGHAAGDIILQDFSKRIQALVRRSDCFGRIGGEEFVLVLPRTSADAAELVLERMLRAVQKARALPAQPDFQYTFSAGISEATKGDTFESLYARADQALYSAKMAGRNRIHRNAA